MSKSFSVSLCSLMFVGLIACEQNQNSDMVAQQVYPSQFLELNCDQLKTQAEARNRTILQQSEVLREAQNMSGAGLAVGLIASPLIGAAITADAQSQRREAQSSAAFARAEFNAINQVANQKGCW